LLTSDVSQQPLPYDDNGRRLIGLMGADVMNDVVAE
jgi:hypothetical protein